MEENLLALLQQRRQQEELAALMSANEVTAGFGLTLTGEDARELAICRNESLAKYHRVEFGKGILEKLLFAFCDSQYLNQESYLETMERLQEIFYAFKNEVGDRLTDDELLAFMREQFETVCFGDADYLRDTCLERLAASVRAGYRGCQKSGGRGEYERLSEEARWDADVYRQVMRELFW